MNRKLKLLPTLLLPHFLLCVGLVTSVEAKDARVLERETEWNSYQIPAAKFTRQIVAEKKVLFRVPADWKQEGNELNFVGPHSSRLRIFLEQIPDGSPLEDIVVGLTRTLRDISGSTEPTLIRRTEIQNIEARELWFVRPDAEGQQFRSTIWVAAHGPLALSVTMVTPVAHSAEIEPFLKAVIQSVMFMREQDVIAFENLRKAVITGAQSSSLNEVQDIVATLDKTITQRDSNVDRLTVLYASAPDSVLDLLIDRRPIVRAAAAEALARTRNGSFAPFLWRLVDDPEALVAAPAARAVAVAPNVIPELIEHSFEGFKTQTVARVWQFLSREKRQQLLEQIFKQTAVTTPPRSIKVVPDKPRVSVTVSPLTPLRPGQTSPQLTPSIALDPSVQLGALTLLSDIPASDFQLPLARIVAANHNPLTRAALQVALNRNEALPRDLLFKLLDSTEAQIRALSLDCIALVANNSDFARLESIQSTSTAKGDKAVESKLKVTIKKVRFRLQLEEATRQSPTSREKIIKEGLADIELADFVWRTGFEEKLIDAQPNNTNLLVKPFAENLLPERVTHYAAIPKPAQTLQRLYESVDGIQLDSAQSQASLALSVRNVRKALGSFLYAPANDRPLIEYSGINGGEPLSVASWQADGAPGSAATARRQVIVLQLSDRSRFENLVDAYQKGAGSFSDLPYYLAFFSRSFAALPAVIPLAAKALLASGGEKPKVSSILKYSFAGETTVGGFPVRIIGGRTVNSEGSIETSISYLMFVDNTVIVAHDLQSLRDVLQRTSQADRPTLAGNSEFRGAVTRGGDVVYFSDLDAVFATAGVSGSDIKSRSVESGELNISKTDWKNSHRIEFEESDWAKPLRPFRPRDLVSAKELLPKSTVAYYMMKVDAAAVWTNWIKKVPDSQRVANLWAIDFEREVLPEIDSECGLALLSLPALEMTTAPPWIAFCKLKSNQLANALNSGKLFRSVPATSTHAEVKSDFDTFFVTIRNGFLVISSDAKAFEKLSEPQKLAAVRDYSRAAEDVSTEVIAFGGYNLEAAVASASEGPHEGLRSLQANILFSIAKAFHSQSLFATASPSKIEAQSSVSMDREGRYAVSEIGSDGTIINYATLEPRGLPLTNQARLSALTLQLRTKTPGALDQLKKDIETTNQIVKQQTADTLTLNVLSRRTPPESPVPLPVTDPKLLQWVQPSPEIPSTQESVVKQAKEIAGDDRDAWSVARKLADWTHQNLEWKVVADADPSRTLATREADCSEFSQLYVAMARSLGLPARTVSGMAFGGSAFGGHAWVEVWVGRWIELDPTWGTDFVDATHIRQETGALMTFGALGLVDLEVLDARRSVAEFQQTPAALAGEIASTLSKGNDSAVESSLDISVLTNELMGAGNWSAMNDAERDQMSSAFRRALLEISDGYGNSKDDESSLRVVNVVQDGDRAIASCIWFPNEVLLKIHMLKQVDGWYLTEIVQTDTALYTVAETLLPSIERIKARRAGQPPPVSAASDFVRALLLLENNAAKSLEIVEGVLKKEPSHRGMRLLKSYALLNLEKRPEALKVLSELSEETPPYAPAIFRLAKQLSGSEDKAETEAASKLLARYVELEPFDPRGYKQIAAAYETAGNSALAEAAYRKVIKIDPKDLSGYEGLIGVLVRQGQMGQISNILDAAEKELGLETDPFGHIMSDLSFEFEDDTSPLVKLAASQPLRVRASAQANLALADIHIERAQYATALNHLKVAARLDPQSAYPHTRMAEVYRKLMRWNLALGAANAALAIDPKSASAHFQKACILARLRRIKEAMAALKQSVELSPIQALFIADEKDLKVLSSLPAFKELLPKDDPEK